MASEYWLFLNQVDFSCYGKERLGSLSLRRMLHFDWSVPVFCLDLVAFLLYALTLIPSSQWVFFKKFYFYFFNKAPVSSPGSLLPSLPMFLLQARQPWRWIQGRFQLQTLRQIWNVKRKRWLAQAITLAHRIFFIQTRHNKGLNINNREPGSLLMAPRRSGWIRASAPDDKVKNRNIK